MILPVLYRSPLTSCNYGCGYFPFANRTDSDARPQPRQGRPWRAGKTSITVDGDWQMRLCTSWMRSSAASTIPNVRRHSLRVSV